MSTLPPNLSLAEHGASIAEFSSQYHHESRCSNLLIRSPTLCWFTSVHETFPQHVVIDMGREVRLARVGLFLHGVNNQNPREISFEAATELAGPWSDLAAAELEHRAGDHMFDLPAPCAARFVRYTIRSNFGGSGAFTTKLFLFAAQ
eukprot:gnl/Chilomastix_cuspidata/3098.p2 GENE.gnl/Chilomastix_cuspidata/3098~~gnl/Chilomastix_cuspidata/3098.p2  ORF type:complete len:147 (+),score=40.48 gnl/Chilomastix_cuspidata/3098:31-471(+)